MPKTVRVQTVEKKNGEKENDEGSARAWLYPQLHRNIRIYVILVTHRGFLVMMNKQRKQILFEIKSRTCTIATGVERRCKLALMLFLENGCKH